ncbi:hypothetical protein KHA80_07870 [Anaerobacillus sp. HL2]|nr:hypothetical protein KHA80_07870 [Anaerobacillus sp. HL2]
MKIKSENSSETLSNMIDELVGNDADIEGLVELKKIWGIAMVERRKNLKSDSQDMKLNGLRKADDTSDMLSNNTYSRDALNYDEGIAKNIHYGDVSAKFGEYLDVSRKAIIASMMQYY